MVENPGGGFKTIAVPVFVLDMRLGSGFGHSGLILVTQRTSDVINKRVALGVAVTTFGACTKVFYLVWLCVIQPDKLRFGRSGA